MFFSFVSDSNLTEIDSLDCFLVEQSRLFLIFSATVFSSLNYSGIILDDKRGGSGVLGSPIEVFVNRKNSVSVGDFSKNYFKLNDIQIKTSCLRFFVAKDFNR
jgi:hypothetical protein